MIRQVIGLDTPSSWSRGNEMTLNSPKHGTPMRSSLATHTRTPTAAVVLSAFVLACTYLAVTLAAQLPPGVTRVPAKPGVDRAKQEAEVQARVALDFWGAWEGPYTANKPIIFHWHLKNSTPITVSGRLTITVDARAASAAGLPSVQGLVAAAERAGDFTLPGLAAG